MVTRDDIVELVLEALKGTGRVSTDFRPQINRDVAKDGKWGFYVRESFNRPYTSLPARKIFLSEHEVKKLLKDSKVLRIPGNAIISPLAEEWLGEKGVEIVRE